jgi:hypothetical protein
MSRLTLSYMRDDLTKGSVPIILTPFVPSARHARTAMACSMLVSMPSLRTEPVQHGEPLALAPADLEPEAPTPEVTAWCAAMEQQACCADASIRPMLHGGLLCTAEQQKEDLFDQRPEACAWKRLVGLLLSTVHTVLDLARSENSMDQQFENKKRVYDPGGLVI